jgi:hypothetical protein
MKIRELHPSEFYKLNDNTWLEPERRPVPGVTRVVVAEDDHGEIQGFAFVQFVPHVEPVFVSQEHRVGFVGKQLFERARGMLSGLGQGGFIYETHATNDRHGEYLEHLGMKRRNGYVVYEGRV